MPNQNKSETIYRNIKMNEKEQSRNPFLDKINESDQSNDLITETESTCMRTLKIMITLLCLIGFCFNSYIIFKQFVGNETLTSHKIEENFDLYLPSITLCGPSGFKTAVEKYSDLELEYYLNNTVDLKDMLINVYDRDNNYIEAKFVEGKISNVDKSDIWKITTTYSAYRGRCYTIEYRKKVRYYL